MIQNKETKTVSHKKVHHSKYKTESCFIISSLSFLIQNYFGILWICFSSFLFSLVSIRFPSLSSKSLHKINNTQSLVLLLLFCLWIQHPIYSWLLVGLMQIKCRCWGPNLGQLCADKCPTCCHINL